MRFTIWQCTDWCCEKKIPVDRWWNVATRPGRYESFPSWADAFDATTKPSPTARWWQW